MLFSSACIEAFRRLSYDENPLHTDAAYARRTPFGQPVVYGVAGVMYTLGQWANGRSFELLKIRAVFLKPLYQGEEYDLKVEENEGETTTIRVRRGTIDRCVITLEARPREPNAASIPSENEFRPQLQPSESDPRQLEPWKGSYTPNWDQMDSFSDVFHIRRGQIPDAQIAALLWSSYCVGMELPGKQALFTELNFTFEPGTEDCASVQLETEPPRFDERFNRLRIRGKGTGIESFQITAFRRPPPVDCSFHELIESGGRDRLLEGKSVFISGASRGFGACLAAICGAQGANLHLNYRSDRDAMEALIRALEDHGVTATAHPADMSDPDAVAKLADSIGALDFIFNNAAPTIPDIHFTENTTDDFIEFTELNLRIALESARCLFPLLKENGCYVQISTKYVVQPAAGFSHYIAAKLAQEGLLQGLSADFPNHRFIVARLPRILTDQTNLPYDLDPPEDTGQVAKELVNALLSGEMEATGFEVVDLF